MSDPKHDPKKPEQKAPAPSTPLTPAPETQKFGPSDPKTTKDAVESERLDPKTEPAQDVPAGHEGLDPQYPLDPPGAAIDLLVSKLRGEEVEMGCAIHACWIIQGYALSKFVPDQHPYQLRAEQGTYTKERVVEALEKTKKQGVAALPAVDWVKIAQALLNFALLWLSQQQVQ